MLIVQLKSWFSSNKAVLKATGTIFLANQLAELFMVLLVASNYGLGSEYSYVCQWDCHWFADIVRNGYDLFPHGNPRGNAANWAFFPFFPLSASGFAFVTGLPAWLSLVVVAKIFFLLAIYSFIQLCKAYEPAIPALLAGGVIAFNPYSIYASVGYTEAMFLFFTCQFFIALKGNHFLLAGLMGGLLSGVRLVGVIATVPYLIKAIPYGLSTSQQERIRLVLGLLLVPLGLGFFMYFLYWRTGDALAFSHIIQLGWNRYVDNPLSYLLEALKGDRMYKFFVLIAFLSLFISFRLFLQKRYTLASFLLICTIIPISSGLLSLPRYIAWQAPFLFGIADILNKRNAWILIMPIFIIGFAYMYFSWIAGKSFVI